jgi:hypothetical protein
VTTGRIDEDGRNDCNRKKDEVDKEFYCHVLFDGRSKVYEGIPESAGDEIEEAVKAEKEVVINNATVIPESGP